MYQLTKSRTKTRWNKFPKPKTLTKIQLSDSSVYFTSIIPSIIYFDEGLGILFFPASLSEEALTCLE